MRIIQRASAWIGWAALLAAGVLLILEATGAIDGGWRSALARAARWVAQPSLATWAAALIGVLVGLVALVVLVAQFVLARMSRQVTVTERTSAGTTAVSAVVFRRAATQRLREIDGISEAAPLTDGKRLSMRVRLAPGTDADRVSRQARAALDDAFWADLGVSSAPSTSPWSIHDLRHHANLAGVAMSRPIIGALVGIVLAVIWHWLGWSAVLWAALFGVIGYGIGWLSEHPEGLIGLLRRLER